jgi:hypothetical protein
VTLVSLGTAAQSQGHHERAALLFEEAFQLERQMGRPAGACHALTELGNVALRQGQYKKAVALLTQSLSKEKELSDKLGMARTFEVLAGVAAEFGEPARVARLLGSADALRDAIGIQRSFVQRADYEMSLGFAGKQLGKASLADRLSQGRTLSIEQAVQDAIEAGEQ